MTRRRLFAWSSLAVALAALAAITGPRLVQLRDGQWHNDPRPEWGPTWQK